MQRAKALELKSFIEREVGNGKVTVALERDSPAGYEVGYAGEGGGFVLTDIRAAEAFIKGFVTAKSLYGPNPGSENGALYDTLTDEPESAEVGSGRGRAR